MGTRKSNDSERTSVRADRTETTNEVREDASPVDSDTFSLNKSQDGADNRLVSELARVALRLRSIYGTALATEFALRQQNAESDTDFAECLRWNVCAPIDELAEQIQSTVERLGGNVPDPLR